METYVREFTEMSELNSIDKSDKGNLWEGVQWGVKTQQCWQVRQWKHMTGSSLRCQNSTVFTSQTMETYDREFTQVSKLNSIDKSDNGNLWWQGVHSSVKTQQYSQVRQWKPMSGSSLRCQNSTVFTSQTMETCDREFTLSTKEICDRVSFVGILCLISAVCRNHLSSCSFWTNLLFDKAFFWKVCGCS